MRVVAAGLLLAGSSAAQAQVFLPDDPLWTDPDRLDMPLPTPTTPSAAYDFVVNTFRDPGDYEGPARNINTVGAVPTSSWFVNARHRPRPRAAVRMGPRSGRPPGRPPWTVLDANSTGAALWLDVRDVSGRRYRLWLDPRGHPELVTGAAMVAQRLYHALGYRVPTHFLVALRAADLEADAPTNEVNRVLSAAQRNDDGTYRAVAAHLPHAERRIGPFRFFGTRPYDGNDVFPHEARRELRGLRVVAAWLHHAGLQGAATRDVVTVRDQRQFVLHYLYDFTSALGSSGQGPKPAWVGHEYLLEVGPVLRRAATLGLAATPWTREPLSPHPAVGRFSSSFFDPRAWKPRVPNPAFLRCDSADAFWAAARIRALSQEAIEGAVAAAHYSNPVAANAITRTLLARRNRIGATHLRFAGGLDRFVVRRDTLHFADLPARYGLRPDALRRLYNWHVFNNASGQRGERLGGGTVHDTSVALPPDARAPFLQVTLRTPGHGHTYVYLRRRASGAYAVVGVRRRDAAEGT